jgi:hypothetical protein
MPGSSTVSGACYPVQMIKTLVGAALLVWAAGCGSSAQSGQDLCKSVQRTSCDKIFDCAEGEPLRATYGGTKADCITMLESACTESTTGCGQGMTYHADVANQCASAVAAVTCAQIGANGDDPLFPAICDSVCTQ